MEVEIEPIRVDTKLDIVDTEAGLGIKSRIHNLAECVIPITPIIGTAGVNPYKSGATSSL
jgi:uncharacterized protein YwlG (UPF0340 family)